MIEIGKRYIITGRTEAIQLQLNSLGVNTTRSFIISGLISRYSEQPHAFTIDPASGRSCMPASRLMKVTPPVEFESWRISDVIVMPYNLLFSIGDQVKVEGNNDTIYTITQLPDRFGERYLLTASRSQRELELTQEEVNRVVYRIDCSQRSEMITTRRVVNKGQYGDLTIDLVGPTRVVISVCNESLTAERLKKLSEQLAEIADTLDENSSQSVPQ